MNSYKVPPDFTGKSYEEWRREIEIWQYVTDLPKQKQAGAIALSLTGRFRQVAIGVPREDLNSTDGVKKC